MNLFQISNIFTIFTPHTLFSICYPEKEMQKTKIYSFIKLLTLTYEVIKFHRYLFLYP